MHYATTADGVSIAFCALGQGPPLVMVPTSPCSHIQLEWEMPEYRCLYQRLPERRRLIRYDTRGNGLSERDVTSYSLDALVLDLEAVVDRLGLERFDLYASFNSGPVGIAFAARHPQRVSHLVLWTCFASGADFRTLPQVDGMASLIASDWGLYAQAMAHSLLGWPVGDHRLAALVRDSGRPETALAFFRALDETDVSVCPECGRQRWSFISARCPGWTWTW